MHYNSWCGTQSRRHSRYLLSRILCAVAFLLSIILSIPPQVVATNNEPTPEEKKLPRVNNGSVINLNESSEPNDFSNARQPTKRIVGGNDAPQFRYPYFVALREAYNGEHKCGGSLVAPDVVMTAAHCESDIKYAEVGKYYSTVNGTSSGDKDETYNTETFEVTGSMYPHPLYNSGLSFSHDVLLFKLNRKSSHQYIRVNTDPNLPSESSTNIEQLESQKNKDVGSEQNRVMNNLIVMGMGSTLFGKLGSSAPEVLQQTKTSYVPNRVCRRSKDQFVDDSYQNLISEDMLCAFEDSQDACQGDSGGPLIQNGNSPSSDILVGIVSW